MRLKLGVTREGKLTAGEAWKVPRDVVASVLDADPQLTRGLLETCLAFRQPVVLITKSALVLRDLDLLGDLARRRLVRVSVSVTTLDDELKRRLEPRTAGPASRLRVIGELAAAGVPVSAMAAPIIPRINDQELEAIVGAVADAGARSASYVLLRLPHEVAPLFRDWLQAHYPDRAGAVMNAVRACRGGRDCPRKPSESWIRCRAICSPEARAGHESLFCAPVRTDGADLGLRDRFRAMMRAPRRF